MPGACCLQQIDINIWTMFSTVSPYKNQHYAELKKNCINSKKLYEDPEFPANNASLFYRKRPPGVVQWKRPGVCGHSQSLTWIIAVYIHWFMPFIILHYRAENRSLQMVQILSCLLQEICSDPHLFVEGISSRDLNQGDVGNCWFVAACACLALKPTLWKKVSYFSFLEFTWGGG